MGNFFKSIENFFKNHFGNPPTILQKAQSILGYIGPFLGFVVTEADPKDAAEVVNVVSEVQTAMGTASAVIAESHSTTDTTAKARVATALNAVANHLTDLEAMGHIKNATHKAAINTGVQELQQVVKDLTA